MKATAAREHGLPPRLAWMDPFPCQGLRLATTPLLAKACLAVIFFHGGVSRRARRWMCLARLWPTMGFESSWGRP